MMMNMKPLKKEVTIICSLLAFLVFKSFNIKAQVFTRKYFEKTKWASKSNDSLFFKADTVKLVKTVEDTYFINGQGMNVPRYFNSDYVQLEFYKNKKLKLSTVKLEEWVIGTFVGEYKWVYQKPKRTLNLYLNGILLCSFVIIPNSAKKISIPSLYAKQPSIETIEISLLKKVKGIY
jgi:hypothetical protein